MYRRGIMYLDMPISLPPKRSLKLNLIIIIIHFTIAISPEKSSLFHH